MFFILFRIKNSLNYSKVYLFPIEYNYFPTIFIVVQFALNINILIYPHNKAGYSEFHITLNLDSESMIRKIKEFEGI